MREKLSYFLYNRNKKRTRKFRKKIKRELRNKRNRNKKLIQKYPWLRVVDYRCWSHSNDPIFFTDPIYISLWEDIPDGWIKTFGYMMCNEIEKTLEKDNIQNKVYIEQAKEKYGQLRIYMVGSHEVQEIIDIYSAISEHVCCRCGKPHVPMMNFSWISPYCSKCFYKLQKRNKNFYKGAYEDYAPKDKEKWKIPNELRWTRFSKEGNKTYTIDISERIHNIERLWNEKHPEDMV